MLPVRRSMQMIFQDPYASLDPRCTVGDIIAEPMNIHNLYTPEKRRERVQELLEIVGLKPDHIRRYPHEFSGGQRQRVSIARTLALDPEFIICDEPISALDVSIQAQIVNLLELIQDRSGISYLFIAHDLGMVRHISHKIGIMYLGNMMEYGATEDVYNEPYHPYTRALLSAVPIPDPKKARQQQRILLNGEIEAPIDPPDACLFANRCAYCVTVCWEKKPPVVDIAGRHVACHLYSNYFRYMRGNSELPFF
jgi:oligopeptide/dipeptide ABC transporter ATP-binding protein